MPLDAEVVAVPEQRGGVDSRHEVGDEALVLEGCPVLAERVPERVDRPISHVAILPRDSRDGQQVVAEPLTSRTQKLRRCRPGRIRPVRQVRLGEEVALGSTEVVH